MGFRNSTTQVPGDVRDLFLIIMGSIWSNRNKISFQGHRGKLSEEIALFASNYYAKYSQLLDRVETPPENGVYKVNFDGVLAKGMAGVGVVI